ncbi:tail fiber domain-containing protein, partial [Cronobacter sakazakii]
RPIANGQLICIRPDNSSTGATGSEMSVNGATGEVRAVKFTNTSDERAKFWIKPVTGALDKICQLKGVTYSMHTTIQNTVRNAGLIAQDVQKVLPEAVSVGQTGSTLDKNCFEVENPLTLDYNALSALYVEAFKEMKSEMDALKAELAELKAAVVDILPTL